MTTVTADIYILRLWLEPSQEGPTWRASVTDAKSQERRYFATPEALTLFLRELVSTVSPAKEDESNGKPLA
jgi:hypothetical protein